VGLKGLFIAGGILVCLFLLLCLPLGVCAVYEEKGYSLTVSLGPLRLRKLPGEKKKAAEKSGKKGKKKEPESRKGGSEAGFRDILSIISTVLGKLKRRLRANELTLWYQSAAKDPAAAALGFGASSAALGALMLPLDRVFKFKKTDVRTAVSFTETSPRVYARLRLSIPVGTLLFLAPGVLVQYLRAHSKGPKDTEESSWKSIPSEN